MDSQSNSAAAPQEGKKGPYTVTVYLAAPGTPVAGKDGTTHSSSAGHAYFMVADGDKKDGYGFSPIKTGITGPGHVVKGEFETYQNPRFSYTLEITKDQYDKLKAYGEASVNRDQGRFNLYYNGLSNSCVDYVWTGLGQAGLRPKLEKPDPSFEGTMKVLPNIDALKSIPKPFPDSKLNSTHENPLPKKQTTLQKLLTEVEGELPPRERLAALSPESQQLFDRMRSDLPEKVSDAQVMSAMVAARENGIHQPQQLRDVVLQEEKIFVMGTTPGFRAMVDLNQPQQSLEEGLARSQQIDTRVTEQTRQETQQREATTQTSGGMQMG